MLKNTETVIKTMNALDGARFGDFGSARDDKESLVKGDNCLVAWLAITSVGDLNPEELELAERDED